MRVTCGQAKAFQGEGLAYRSGYCTYLSGILTLASGRLSTWTVSMNLTLLLLSFITSDEEIGRAHV